MTARLDPPADESQHSDNSSHSQQPLWVYDTDSTETSEETSYVPEREFVLMPLFRRIGELLGIRREPEEQGSLYELSEPVEQTATLAGSEGRVAEFEPPAKQTAPAPVASTAEHIAPPVTAGSAEDVLGIEPVSAMEIAEPPAVEPDLRAPERTHESLEEPVASAMQPLPIEPEPIQSLQQTAEEHMRVEEVAEPVSHSPEQQVNEMLAPLRETITRISATIAESVQWLRGKEEEILRRAELSESAAAAPELQNPSPSAATSMSQLSESKAAASTAERAELELLPPAIQLETGWDQSEQWSKKAPIPISSYTAKETPKPNSVNPVDIPVWKRIRWSEQFTAKRAALAGAIVMAALLVVGISLARRPASTALPQQPASLEPGGVTLTTHPSAAPTVASQQSRPSARPQPTRRAHRRGVGDDGPDVVTHYYNTKQKPSPVKQTTVAGVRHYSDM